MKIVLKCLIFLLVLGCSSDDKSGDPNNQPNNTNNTNNQTGDCLEELECPDFYSEASDCGGDCLTVTQCDTNETIECVQDDDGDGGCNNEFADCPDGYEEDFDCFEESATCVEVGGTCGADSGYFCSCSKCYGSEVDSCDGLTDCQAYDSCGETKFCATCEDAECGDRETVELNVEWCEESQDECRLEVCPSAPQVSYSCYAVRECPDTPDCPAGTVSCDVESATCLMTKTCGTTLLCEAM